MMETRTNSVRGLAKIVCWVLLTMVAVGGIPWILKADESSGTSIDSDLRSVEETAVVKVDGVTLFRVRPLAGHSAEDRARAIARRIQSFASNVELSTDAITLDVLPDRTILKGAGLHLANILDSDAAIERLPRSVVAESAKFNTIQAVLQYRRDTSRPILIRRTIMAVVATVLLFGFLVGIGRLFRWARRMSERKIKTKMEALEVKSSRVIESRPLWAAVMGLLNGIQVVVTLILVYAYLNLVLGLYPWTRGLAEDLFSIFVNPLAVLWSRFVVSIPNLVFLAVLFFLARYLIKLARLFFSGIDSGTIQFEKFERDWAWPTYRIARVLVIAFVAVVAYPYIPGSSSAAFKGVSIFMGVLFSLGSSSFIANIIAGTTMTYRRAFKIGDIIKTGSLMGMVTDIRLQATHLRTYRNEEIVIPNGQLLNGDIINYTTLSRNEGLVLSVTVGIGYETPWRQVEAMLLLAAERTSDLMNGKKPFVLQKALGDFAVQYELNVYCDKPTSMLGIYTELHKNVLDVFNEYGVQIMTPAYEGDPEQPKVVAKKDWFTAPANKSPEKPTN